MKHFLVLLCFLSGVGAFAQNDESKSYESNSNIIANPERGFYHHTEVHSTNYSPLSLNTLVNYKENEAITQILRVFYLEEFINRPISQSYIDNMHKDFNIARQAGLKIIVRFAYSQSQNAEFKDATPKIVQAHMLQLKEIFDTHTDVIAVIQTGFIGAWGEWYYTDHFAETFPSNVTEQNWQDRTELLENYLDVVPNDRVIQLRTPGYKMTIFDTEEPIDASIAYNQTNIARVGHHNDCFVASSSDFGTYINPTVEKPYLEQETTFLPMGGETCAVAPPYSDCENAYQEMARFHWSYMNIDYNAAVLNVWKDQGCFDDVELNLGYRISVNEATIRNNIHSNGTFQLNLQIFNHGFANPYNPRKMEVILEDQSTNIKYRLTTNENIGLWPIQEEFTVEIMAGFPDNMPEGNYKIYLALPDSYASLKNNPDYSIQLANNDMWIPSTGYNDLDFELNVNNTNTQESYSGDDYFSVAGSPQLNDNGPKEIFVGDNEDARVLFWGRSTSHIDRQIERSTNGTDFELLATLPSDNDFYRLYNQDQDYTYRYALLNQQNEISYSDQVLAEISNVVNSDILITVDGEVEDWKDTRPIASTLAPNGNSYILRTSFDANTASLLLYGNIENYRIYLNTDEDLETGNLSPGVLQGMDYLIKDAQLYVFQDGDWTLASTIFSTVTNGTFTELQIPIQALENIGVNAIIPIVAQLNNDELLLSQSETEPAIYVRQIPAQIPTGLDIKNSSSFPDIRLEVYWDRCVFCSGYILEYSEDGENFVFLKDLAAEKDFYYHDFLTDGTYYYRIKSYNDLGESAFSDVESGSIGPLNIDPSYGSNEWKVFPNPVENILELNHPIDAFEIYNTQGKLVQSQKNMSSNIDVSRLISGHYSLIVTSSTNQEQIQLTFIKL